MEQTVKVCSLGTLDASLQEISSANLVLLMAGPTLFQSSVDKMKECLPNTPNIGVCGSGYTGTKDCPKDIIVVGFHGCESIVDIIPDAQKPILSVAKLMEHIKKLHGTGRDTICLDFTAANDSVIVTTLNSCLNEHQISLVGATAEAGKVSFNGVVYDGGCVYALIKNKNGSICSYKENIYSPDEQMPNFIATEIDEASQKIITLDNKKASLVYQNVLAIQEKDIETQTFKNPIGRLVGDDVYIISVQSKCDDGSLICYKRTNPMDSLTILKLDDYKSVISDTVQTIKKDLPRLKGVFSINCILRYLMFTDIKYMDEYLRTMNSLGTHVGLVGYGEHYNAQHVNQTMTCFAFD